MRLPPRHPPPATDAPARRCAHLEALAGAAQGLCLGPAADALGSRRSRGRHGSALQWHLGLAPHDSLAALDWEDRIEIKLVSVWARGDGAVACDKLKVCDASVDPAHKLGNALFVFADRLTRVVVGHRFFRLAGPARARLAAAFADDPHFERARLWIESRDQDGRSSPAYYVAPEWLEAEGLLPAAGPGIFPFDARLWSALRAAHAGRDPRITVVGPGQARVACPRCGGPIEVEPARVDQARWAPGSHGSPAGDCLLRAHVVVSGAWLCCPAASSVAQMVADLERRGAELRRLSDGIEEPGDHLH
jgi:hypothetical protein